MTENIVARNNVRVFGEGARTMVFAHGFGCDQNMWRRVASAFENDFRIVLFDYVGSGKSDRRAYSTERYGTLSGYAQDLLDVCAALELEEAVFVGHSVSGMIGALASIHEPKRFSDLVMVCPSPRYINDGDYVGGFERADIDGLLEMMDQNYLGWASFLAPVVMKNDDRPELAKELEDSFCSTDPKTARLFAEVTFYSDNRADLPKVATPSLIIQCADDAIAPMDVGEFLSRHLSGSTLQVIEAMGHCPHLSHPEETVRVIREYLAARAAVRAERTHAWKMECTIS